MLYFEKRALESPVRISATAGCAPDWPWRGVGARQKWGEKNSSRERYFLINAFLVRAWEINPHCDMTIDSKV